MNRIIRGSLPWIIVLALALWVAYYLSGAQTGPKQISYSDFYNSLLQGNVSQLHINGANATGVEKSGPNLSFQVVLPPGYNTNNQFVDLLHQKEVSFDFANNSSSQFWAPLVQNVLPLILVLGLFMFLLQQTQGGGNRVMQFGKSRAKLHAGDERKRVTFDDVAGVDEAKEELGEVVDFLKHPKKYLELGARIPKGVLLFGEPGTGKTLLARAVAGEAGVPFYSISGSDFVEMFVGVGASRVRDLFEQAKKSSPCIVFIDEIDAVGRMRGAGYGGGHDEREQTLNQLLVEMDGFGANEGIIVIAGTNRPDVLDPALLRPGRFDRQIAINKPDLLGRKAILDVHSKGKPMERDMDMEVLARRTPGFTGADLANLINEAALLAARRRKKKVSMDEAEEAIERVIAGPQKKSRVISEKEKRVVAYHEAGHALVGKMMPNADPVHKLSIIPRGMALGYTLQMPVEDRYLITGEEILDRVTMALGGRAAERLVFNEATNGAHDDLEKSTKMVRKMITEFGMSEALGPMTYGTPQEQVFLGRDLMRDRNYSEEVAAAIDREVKRIIGECYNRAYGVLKDNRKALDKVAEALLEKETIAASELDEMLKEIAEKAS